MTLTSQLNTLESAGLVRIAQYEPDLEYLFRHALVQEAAYASLLVGDRTRLHQLVGRAMEGLYAGRLDEHAAELAHHFERAGDRPRAFDYSRRAGENALASYANREAEGHFRRALELGEGREQQAACLDGLGEALSRQSRYSEAIQVWRRAIQRFLEAGDYDRAARIYARAARSAWHGGFTEEGLRICEEGLQAVGHAPTSHGQALLVHEAGRACYFNGQPERARDYCQRALEMAEELGAGDVLADTLTTRTLLPGMSRLDRRRDLERATALAEPAGLLAIASRAHHNLGSLLAGEQEFHEQAYGHFMRAAELCRQRGVVSEEVFSRMSAMTVLLDRLELDRVEQGLAEIRQMLLPVADDVQGTLELNGFQAALDWLRGDLDTALARLAENRRLARQEGNLQSLFRAVGEPPWLMVIEHFWGRPVDLDQAFALAQEALQLALRGLAEPAFAYALLTIISVQRGDLRAAGDYQRQADQDVNAQDPLQAALVEFSRVHLLADEGRLDEALAVLEGVLDSGVLRPKRIDHLRTRLYQAELYRRRGQPADLEEARRIFREVEGICQQAGVIYYLDIARERLEMLHQARLVQDQDHAQVVREMANAGRVQESFLPKALPEVPGWDLAAMLDPARQTSGDFYDFIPLPDGRLAFLVADVADKGAGAALFMALTRSLLRTYAAAYPDDPARVLHETNQRLLADSSRALFVTLFYGVLEVGAGRLLYCNAGHNPPYHVPAGAGALRPLALTGIPLGVEPEASWQSGALELQPGDLLALYTDGVTEAQDEGGAFYGEARLEASLQRSRGAGAQAVLQGAAEDLQRFVGAASQADDITLVVLRRD